MVLAAEVIHSAREEMACHLDDFVFRRSGLGTLGNPGEGILRRCAELMGDELGWDASRADQEVAQTVRGFVQQAPYG